jgi:hypothetical protein
MRPNPRFLVLACVAALSALAFSAASSSGAIKLSDGTFLLDLPLSKPITVAPPTGALLQYPSDPIKLTWRPVPGAGKYDVQVAREASSTVDCNTSAAWQLDNIVLTHNTTETGWVPELTDKAHGSDIWTGTFCWRVRASGKANGMWSAGSRFSVSWPAQAGDLKFFSDETGDVPRAPGAAAETQGFDTGYLEWGAVAGAAQYEVQISKATTFGDASLFATKIYPNTRMLLPQMPDNLYTWRVRPITSTGIKGSWSGTSTFRIFHDDRYWGGAANGTSNTLYPADGANVDDVRIGWEPVPGASSYQFEAISLATTFSEIHNMTPYGGFSNSTNCSGSVEGRISDIDATVSSTVNNWVTWGGLFGRDVMALLKDGCTYDPTPPDVNGVDANPNDDETVVFPPPPSTIYWRVYPVWNLSTSTEEGWKVSDTKILGKPIERQFNPVEYNPTTAAPAKQPVAGAQCRYDINATPQNCLRNLGGGMSPLNPSMDSTTMQVPYFEWGTFPGANPNRGPGSFRVQIAQDRQFDFMLGPNGADPKRGWIASLGQEKRDLWADSSAGQQHFGGYIRSFALTSGLPDEGQVDGDGYFWRSIPCQSYSPDGLCLDFYKDATDVQHSPGIAYGVPGSGALQFKKKVEVSTAAVDGFTPTTPMLKVGPVDAGTDFAKWQRGVQGADHYEFELARNQAFDDQDKVYKTTVPRIVPWGATPQDLLEPGTWFWRVRAVDRDGLAGSWSDTTSFTAKAPAPAIAATSSTIGVGGTVEWSPITGATGYEIAWSADDGFGSGVTTNTTKQTAFYIPATAAGNLYWRVRAQTGASSYTEWSDPRAITILSPSHIPTGVSLNVLNVGTYAIVEGKLIIAGTARNGQAVRLERKGSSCSGTAGYAKFASAVSGRNLDDGYVRFKVRIAKSQCYRLAWDYSTGTVYGAAFELGARPVVSFMPLQRRVTRGKNFCSKVVSRSAITGTLQVQYKVGKVWVAARTQPVRNMKVRNQCAAINRAGTFRVRLVLKNMVDPAHGWKQFEDTTVDGGSVRTNDVFTRR